jgi:hypothetical protein
VLALTGVGVAAALAVVVAAGWQGRVWQPWVARIGLLWSGGDGNRPVAVSPGVAFEGDGRAQLGQYQIRTYDPISGSTVQSEFELKGLTTCGDEAAFWRFMQGHERGIREQVMVTLRNSGPTELSDSELLARKIAARVNRSLDRPFLESLEVEGLRITVEMRRPAMLGPALDPP